MVKILCVVVSFDAVSKIKCTSSVEFQRERATINREVLHQLSEPLGVERVIEIFTLV